MKLLFITLLLLGWNQNLVAKVPRSVLPKSIEKDISRLQTKFNKVLKKECRSECFPKSCVYGDHKVVREKDSSLPGLNFDNKSTKSLDYQYYLTKAECSYAYEGDISADEVKSLNQRLQTKLSDSQLRVSIKSKELSNALESESEVIPDELNEKLSDAIISVLPYILVLLSLLLSAICFIWAIRRVGKESFSEKLKRLNLERELEKPDTVETSSSEPVKKIDVEEFIATNIEDETLKEILRSWLKAEKHDLIFSLAAYTSAKNPVFFSDKIELFKEKRAYYDKLESGKLNIIGEENFIKELKKSLAINKGLRDRTINLFDAINSSIDIIKLGNEMKRMPVDFASLIFVLSNSQRQTQLISFFSPDQKSSYLSRLLTSPFFPKALPEHLYEWIDAEENATSFDYSKVEGLSSVTGIDFEVSEAVNKLLNASSSEERNSLLEGTRDQYGGKMPNHLDGIFYKDMLLDLDATSLTNLASYVDTRKLALYLSLMFTAEERSHILSSLPTVMAQKLNSVDRSLLSRKDEIILEMEASLAKAMSKLES